MATWDVYYMTLQFPPAVVALRLDSTGVTLEGRDRKTNIDLSQAELTYGCKTPSFGKFPEANPNMSLSLTVADGTHDFELRPEDGNTPDDFTRLTEALKRTTMIKKAMAPVSIPARASAPPGRASGAPSPSAPPPLPKSTPTGSVSSPPPLPKSTPTGSARAPSTKVDTEVITDLLSIIQHDLGLKMFKEHMKVEYSEENINFWHAVEKYKRKSDKDRQQAAEEVCKRYIKSSGEEQVNIDNVMQKQIIANVEAKHVDKHTFDEASAEIYKLMNADTFKRFKESPLLAKFYAEKDAFEADEEKRMEETKAKLLMGQAGIAQQLAMGGFAGVVLKKT